MTRQGEDKDKDGISLNKFFNPIMFKRFTYLEPKIKYLKLPEFAFLNKTDENFQFATK